MARWLILLVPLVIAIAIFASVIRDLVRRARLQNRRDDLERRAQEHEKEALRLPGGHPDNPIIIETPAVVETLANSRLCARCGGDLRFEEHVVEPRGRVRLRIARMKCVQCGTHREIYFRLQKPFLN